MTHLNGTAVVIWAPGSGKTHHAQQLATANPEHVLIHTDDFIQYWFEDQLYKLIEHLATYPAGTKFIIEWVGCYRLLRKWAELGTFYPDIIIELIVPTKQLKQVYESRSWDYDKSVSMQKGNETVYEKYKQILADQGFELPKHIFFDNTFIETAT